MLEWHEGRHLDEKKRDSIWKKDYIWSIAHIVMRMDNFPNKNRETHPKEVEADVKEIKNKSLWLDSNHITEDYSMYPFKATYGKIRNKYICHVLDYISGSMIC